jgi:hypothetical protein
MMSTTFGPSSFEEFEDRAIEDPVVLQALARRRRRRASVPNWLCCLLLAGGALVVGLLVGRLLLP